MSDVRSFLVVGASLAGARAAQTLREEGFEGRIVLLGDEPVRPYQRPPLSKEYLQGKAGLDKVFVHDEAYYREHDIDLRLSTHVDALDTKTREVVLASGGRLAYDAVLLTTGAEPRRLQVPGSELAGVHSLRTLADSDRLRAAIGAATRVVVIGGDGSAARWRRRPVWRGPRSPSSKRARWRSSARSGPSSARSTATSMPTTGWSGTSGPAWPSCAGRPGRKRSTSSTARPSGRPLRQRGGGHAPHCTGGRRRAHARQRSRDRRVPQDECPRGVRGRGCRQAWHPVFQTRIRLEHWSSERNQGPVAVKNMLGLQLAYERIPYFFSDQYDVGMEYSGRAVEWDQIVYRGDPATREFVAFWLKADVLLAGMAVNTWDMADPISALVAGQRPVDVDRLRDPDVELSQVVR
jgi:3-phenylpropionate/trans-cinnamate dioxygenase ferredoxin reductase component